MSEIEIGEYVRTEKGIIGKFKGYSLSLVFRDDIVLDHCTIGFDEDDIKAHSKNIIDLIEEGDYVNGYKVVETYKNNELKGWQIGKEKEEIWLGVIVNSKMIKEPLEEYLDNNMIKTIVTKEQFNSVMYKVGDIE